MPSSNHYYLRTEPKDFVITFNGGRLTGYDSCHMFFAFYSKLQASQGAIFSKFGRGEQGTCDERVRQREDRLILYLESIRRIECVGTELWFFDAQNKKKRFSK